MSSQFLDTPIEYLKGVGPSRAELLRKELGIHTFDDLLTYYPFRYVDRTKFHKINEIRSDLPYIQIKGKITQVETIGFKKGKRLVAYFTDGTGVIELVWFKGVNWIVKQLKPDKEYVAFGKPTEFNGKYNIAHPDLDVVADENLKLSSALQAVYHSSEKLGTKGLNSKGIAKLQQNLLSSAQGKIPETLPEELLSGLKFFPREQAVMQVHLPKDPRLLEKARLRLKFEELLLIQLRLLRQKLARNRKLSGFVFDKVGGYFNRFYNENLPFELTNAQKRVMKEIRNDLGSGQHMNRLLQGDVGSGKTLVALMSMLIALDNGFQSALIAPTEILAAQHYESVSEFVKGLGINVALLTGSTKTAERRNIHQMLENGELHFLVGTHAVLEEKVKFNNLGLAVIDEQHRFGVEQRAKMWKKNQRPPHVLVMTATPIPRTLAMTLYGDLDVSVIDELPPGRKPVKTVHRYDSSRIKVFGFMEKQIKEGRQVYVVYPLIQESEKMDYKDLMDGYESIARRFPLPKYKVSIVHGKMKPADKEYEMQRFIRGETQIMVATSVIEVGVNVPNASVMVIESAERFGLSQLHQLRGRVGRGADQSYCILMTRDKLGEETRFRMETMVRTNDGFEIADADLQIRGPGDIEGTQQSGMLDLVIADLSTDGQILKYARQVATDILRDDPDLSKPVNKRLVSTLKKAMGNKPNWGRIS